jgi:hypothetical protein
MLRSMLERLENRKQRFRFPGSIISDEHYVDDLPVRIPKEPEPVLRQTGTRRDAMISYELQMYSSNN